MEERERKALQLGMLNSKLKELEQQIMLLEKQVNELQVCQMAIDELKNIKPDKEMLAPINPGVFVKAKIVENDKLIIDCGSGVFCKKSLGESTAFVQEKLNQAIDLHDKLMKEINNVIESMGAIEKELV